MAVKYKREGHEQEPFSWDVKGRSPKNTRQRLLFIYIGLGAASVFLLMFQYMGKNALERWLPERNGEGVVIEKILETDDNGVASFFLAIEVNVPPASELEAGYLMGENDDVAVRSGERVLGQKMATDPVSWEAVSEGTVILVDYQINMQRDDIIIRGVSLINPYAEDSDEEIQSDPDNAGPRETAP